MQFMQFYPHAWQVLPRLTFQTKMQSTRVDKVSCEIFEIIKAIVRISNIIVFQYSLIKFLNYYSKLLTNLKFLIKYSQPNYLNFLILYDFL